MTIDCFFIAWNESETIHLTLKHYLSFCRSVTVFDNFSTDNTREIAESMGAKVQLFGIQGELNDKEYLKVKNHCWKGSDADWVIVCDCDEILWHPKLGEVLRSNIGMATIFNCFGWNIFSNEIPKENWLEITTGVQDINYSKHIIFDPKKITEINYQYGCHSFTPEGPKGKIEWGSEPLFLLHYKQVGGAKRLADRHAIYAPRLSQINKKWEMGKQYEEPSQDTIKYFNDNLALAKPLW